MFEVIDVVPTVNVNLVGGAVEPGGFIPLPPVGKVDANGFGKAISCAAK